MRHAASPWAPPRLAGGSRPDRSRRRSCRVRAVGLLLALGVCLPGSAAGEPATEVEAVVLLHGLARSDRSMQGLADRLAEVGYRVHNLAYPSTEQTPEQLIDGLASALDACCADASRLHFVTHSLGGILVRAHLAAGHPANLGRVVMLAPPNQGSEVVDALGGTALFRWVFGPTGQALGTGADSLPNRLPPADYALGIVAGTSSLNPLGSALIPGDDDGAVSIERTRLNGMTEHITVAHSHTFIMQAPDVAEHVVHFLARGSFEHADD